MTNTPRGNDCPSIGSALDGYLRDARAAVSSAGTRKHPKQADRVKAVSIVRQIIADESILFLDTETTGVGNVDEILQIAIVDCNGNRLLDTRVKPSKCKSWTKAQEIHGIAPADVENAPTFGEVWAQVENLILGKTVVVYNVEYDLRLISQSARLANVPHNGLREKTAFKCAMKIYSQFVGEVSGYGKDYKWQKLPGARAHDAVEDCLATVALMKAIGECSIS